MSELFESADYRQALDYAFRLLGYRARTTMEMKERLKRKGFSITTADLVITKLLADGYLNDEEFVCGWVAGRMAEKPIGRNRLADELRFKGIEQEIVDRKLDLLCSPLDELTRARELAVKRWQSMRGLPAEKAWHRLCDFLQRRGFDWDTIEAVRHHIQHDLDTICKNG